MSDKPVLLFLHGVGTGDPEGEWNEALSPTLQKVGYPDLSEVDVRAPQYRHVLHGVDKSYKLPETRVKALKGAALAAHTREVELRTARLEQRFGFHAPGKGVPFKAIAVDRALKLTKLRQAKNYLANVHVRAKVLTRVLETVPETGAITIVAHSLGSVIAADLLRRLPPEVKVAGLITIGSPLGVLSARDLKTLGLPDTPPPNVEWWLALRNTTDPVSGGLGIARYFPWALDELSNPGLFTNPHAAKTYLSDPKVAEVIGFSLFGSLSKELVPAEKALAVRLDTTETMTLLALRYAHHQSRILANASNDHADRYDNALRLVQHETARILIDRAKDENRPIPSQVAKLDSDILTSKTNLIRPSSIKGLSIDEAVSMLISVEAANVMHPYDISVSREVRLEALKMLATDLGYSSQLADYVFETEAEVQKIFSSTASSYIKFGAIGLGAVALLVGTGGLALAATPGLVGAAAITSALAGFGPGGMIGGLLTAGTLVSVGGGGLSYGISSQGASPESVEAAIAIQLSGVIVRKKQNLQLDDDVWSQFASNLNELSDKHYRLSPYSDKSSNALKDLEKKIDILEKAMSYLEKNELTGLEDKESKKP